MLTDRVIEEGTLLVEEDSLSFDIRIPWYRSLPLSCVEGIEVRVDSTSVPAADTWIAFGDATYGLGDLAPLHDDWWTVTDPARVRVQAPGGFGSGPFEIDVTLSIRIPYIVERDRRLVMRERCVKTLTPGSGSR